jgi:DNA-binding XRE family transcriptional regulator
MEYPIQNILHGILFQGVILGVRRIKADLQVIGSRIKTLRGDTPQEELAAYLHIRQGQLSKIERGMAAPSIDVLVHLSDRFHKSVDWILRGDGK